MSRHITLNGITRNLASWARNTGLNTRTISKRLAAGCSVADALDTKETRGAHMKGRRHPEWVKKKIGESVKRAHGPAWGRITLVPLASLHDYLPTHHGLADSLIYADPLDLLCAAETVEQRMKELR